MATIQEALQDIHTRLMGHTETPALEARLLAAFVTEKTTTWIAAHPEESLNQQQIESLERLTHRRESGEPLPYILGKWEFYGLDFTVNPAVLIPRPETELLVETALAWLKANPERRRAADVGTGSGCIAVTLAVKVPNLTVTATDLSPEALATARENAEKHGVSEQICFVETDLLAGEAGPFDLICANLPYIPTETLQDLEVYRHEPVLALFGGEDGLDLIRKLLEQAQGKLAPGGLALLEIEASQGEAAIKVGQAAFPGGEIHILKDFAGKDRLLVVKLEN